jgi:hypothetical protein
MVGKSQTERWSYEASAGPAYCLHVQRSKFPHQCHLQEGGNPRNRAGLDWIGPLTAVEPPRSSGVCTWRSRDVNSNGLFESNDTGAPAAWSIQPLRLACSRRSSCSMITISPTVAKLLRENHKPRALSPSNTPSRLLWPLKPHQSSQIRRSTHSRRPGPTLAHVASFRISARASKGPTTLRSSRVLP